MRIVPIAFLLSSRFDPSTDVAWIIITCALLILTIVMPITVILITRFLVIYLGKKTTEIERQAKQRQEALEEILFKRFSSILSEELLRKKDPARWEDNVKSLIQVIREMKRVDPSLTNDQIRLLLQEDGYPEGVLEEALRRI